MTTTPRLVQRKVIRTFKDLEVYQDGFELSKQVFVLTRQFPREELYGLTVQMRNASRSIPANIAEGWAKRQHEMVFKRQLLDAIGSANEMLVWVDTARSCEYLSGETHHSLIEAYQVLGRRLHQPLTTWKTFR